MGALAGSGQYPGLASHRGPRGAEPLGGQRLDGHKVGWGPWKSRGFSAGRVGGQPSPPEEQVGAVSGQGKGWAVPESLWGPGSMARPSRTPAAPGEPRVPAPQSQRSQVGQGKLLVRPGQGLWPGIGHTAGVDQVTGRPEVGRRPPPPRAASQRVGLAERAGLSGVFLHEGHGMGAQTPSTLL